MRNVRYIILSTVGVLLIYIGWTYYEQWSESRKFINSQKEEEAKRKRDFAATYGGGQLKIMQFSADPAVIIQGEKAQICYGVINSKSVRIEPPIGDTWPSLSRCIEVTPKKDTTYNFTAEDEKGNTKTATLTIKVN
jgi:hypothetical protein